MKIFTFQANKQLAAWTIIIGTLLFYLDGSLDFRRFGVVRCGPGSYEIPLGRSTEANNCSDIGLLGRTIATSRFYSFLFWLLISLILLTMVRVLVKKTTRRDVAKQ